jgi:Zn-dependent M28 family amino/carboxypeptidase
MLKNEYVVFSSHMDHVGTVGDGVGGCSPFTRPDGSIDNICNGADDDASGTIGVLSVAHAAASLKKKPKRTMVFINVSGEEKGLLGSAWYGAHPTLPMDKTVANINMDMIGRNATDSIVVIGKEHSDLGVTLAAVQGRHPELKLVAADDIWPEQNFYSRSDHFNFAKKGVPVLFFFNGTHPQYHRADDEVKLIDTSKLARVAQLGFYFAVDIANTPARPKWNPDSYQLIVVEGKTPPAVKKASN